MDLLEVHVRPFLRALFSGALTPDDRIEVRTLPQPGPRAFCGDVNDAAQDAYSHSGKRDVYVGVALRDSATVRGRKQDCTRCQVVWSDLDAKGGFSLEARWSQLTALEVPPDLVMSTGGGYHAYWYVAPYGPEDFDAAGSLMESLAVRLGADHVGNIDRIMRVPGTVNLKYDDRPVAQMVRHRERRHGHEPTLADLSSRLAVVEPVVVPQNGQVTVLAEPGSTAEQVRLIERVGVDEHGTPGVADGRNPAMWKWMQYKRNLGYSIEDAILLARLVNTGQAGYAGFRPALALSEVEGIAKRVWGWERFEPLERAAVTVGTESRDGTAWQEIDGMNFPEPEWVVDRLIPVGLTLVVGRPKLGKSWFTQQVATSVTAGARVFGEFDSVQGGVLYYALEDSWARLNRRLKAYTPEIAPNDRLRFFLHMPRLDAQGLVELSALVDATPGVKMVVIDLLASARPSRRKDAALYDEDAEIMSALQRVALDRGVAVVVLHHARKLDSSDPMDAALGSTGITGPCDMVLVLTRKRGETSAHVTSMGRDVEETRWMFEWDRETCLWTCHGSDDEWDEPVASDTRRGRPDTERSAAKGKIVDLLAAAPGRTMPRSDAVSALVDGGDMSVATLNRAARQLIDSGLVRVDRDPSDRRQSTWTLTGDGDAVILRI